MQKLHLITTHPLYRRLTTAILILFIGLFAGLFSGAGLVYGQTNDVRDGISATGVSVDSGAAETQINNVIADIINLFSWVVGIISVIMIIIGGLKYITSAGDSNSVSSAKNTIIYAIVGLVVVAFAQIIVLFVLDRID